MRNSIFIVLLATVGFFFSCTSGQTQSSNTKLSATQFAEKANALSSAAIIDVRTPDEFSKGHLKRAVNYDWNGNDFNKQVSGLDKSKPVFVYCLVGGRSASAASQLRSDGFKEVYELDGGIMKWRAANLPLATEGTGAPAGMSRQQFNALLVSDKTVLIDFYADWCGPCKKMKPYLDEISKELADKVVVIRINADDNQQLCKELNVDALPVLQVYKATNLTWANTGFISKQDLLTHLQ
jgi:thioredoxin